MTFSLSANIESQTTGSDTYIVTPNVQRVVGEIVNHYQVGIHAFTIIGTYGTGKSSFLLKLQDDLLVANNQKVLLKDAAVLSPSGKFEVLSIVGRYCSLNSLLLKKLKHKVDCDSEDAIEVLQKYYKQLRKHDQTLVIIIDEFGKNLEYAAQNNPERELYFIQEFAEFVNALGRRVLLLTTLHQNFSAYASKLSVAQKTEWNKVKGRMQEVVFAEPVEQLLYLAADAFTYPEESPCKYTEEIYEMSKACKLIAETLPYDVFNRLSPLDAFSSFVLTKAIQRYGQNERSLFSFLFSNGQYSLKKFVAGDARTYSLCDVYDYLANCFHSYLNDANIDSMSWSAIQTALERVEAFDWEDGAQCEYARCIVKAIGLLNIFGNAGFSMPRAYLADYARYAMDVTDAAALIELLERLQVIRFAEYRKRFVLFEGTDVNIEEEVAKAKTIVPVPANPVDELRPIFSHAVASVKAEFYHKGTPRYFEYILLDSPSNIIPEGDVDGYIQLICSNQSDIVEAVKTFSGDCENAIVLAVFRNVDVILKHLHLSLVYDYILEKVLIDKSDYVAIREIVKLKAYEKSLLLKEIKESLFSYDGKVEWIYQGNTLTVTSQRGFNVLLSRVCQDVYPLTPIINNELINRHKLSSTISAARVKYLQALASAEGEENLGFPANKFPPEKTIYYTLLKSTGLYANGEFREKPLPESGIINLWNASEEFLLSTQEKSRKIADFIKVLSSQPYKLKAGLLDFWIPTYLFIKRHDLSLFSKSGSYIPLVNMEFFELLKKHPAEYSVKSYAEDGVKLAFYNQYRKFIRQDEISEIKGTTFLETIKPFFFFYNQLNDYAKHTRKFDNITTLRFRDVLASAKDPERTFLEDLPEALGYDKFSPENGKFVADYCQTIKRAVRELRGCYEQLINRIEEQLVVRLSLSSSDYMQYIVEIKERLAHIKVHLLSGKQKEFFNHVMVNFDSRTEWYQSICYAALDQPLERLKDEQEEQLIDNIVYLYNECEKQSVISKALSFPATEQERSASLKLQQRLEQLLTDDVNLNVYTLVTLLKKTMQ